MAKSALYLREIGGRGRFSCAQEKIFPGRAILDKKYQFRAGQQFAASRVQRRPQCAPKFFTVCVCAGQRGWRCVSPILRDTSPGSVEIPGFFLCLQRFWAVGIETDIYRLVRLGAVKTPPIRPHLFEDRPCQRNCPPVSNGMRSEESIERPFTSRGSDTVLGASIL